MKKIIRYFRKIVTKISPKLSSEIMYRVITGKKLNLENPVTFNDKINWLKIYEYPNNAFISDCADKYVVRDYLKKMKLEKYLVKLIGVWDDVEDIDWNIIPEKFVIKCNHGSGYNYICTNKRKTDLMKVKKKIKQWMNEDFGLVSGELHYSKIKRKIICEEFLEDGMTDLQFWCANGEILFIAYINNPHGENLKKCFNENWNELNFVTSLPKNNKNIEKPVKLSEAIKISKKISKDFIFVRVDFYILNNNELRISELTFTPGSGYLQWNPSSYDEYFGKSIMKE